MRAGRLSVIAAFVFATGLAPGVTEAFPILLNASAEAQLESWLGQGSLDFTNIYEKAAADTSTDFHAAVDAQGPTVTLLQAVFGGKLYAIGGYNPQSWNSGEGYHLTFSDADRTAFIYNLTTDVKQDQRLTSDSYGDFGRYQTSNLLSAGPTFGGGYDLFVDFTLASGSAFQYSYGSGAPCGYGGTNILGVVNRPICSGTFSGGSQFSVIRLETYTFAPTTVTAMPEPASMALFGMGLVGLALHRRRRDR